MHTYKVIVLGKNFKICNWWIYQYNLLTNANIKKNYYYLNSSSMHNHICLHEHE